MPVPRRPRRRRRTCRPTWTCGRGGRQPARLRREHRRLPPAQGHRRRARAGRPGRHRAGRPAPSSTTGCSPRRAHVNHVQLERPATARCADARRRAGPLELVPAAVAQGALRRVAHTAEVRRIASGRGRYGIRERRRLPVPGSGVRGRLGAARRPPAASGERLVACTRSAPTPAVRRPAGRGGASSTWPTEADLPVPLRPRRLLALLRAARGAAGSAPARRCRSRVRVDGARARTRADPRCAAWRTSRTARPGDPLAGWQVMVDAVDGRLHPFRDGRRADPPALRVAARLRRDRGRRAPGTLRPHARPRAGPRRRPVPRRPRTRRSRGRRAGRGRSPTTRAGLARPGVADGARRRRGRVGRTGVAGRRHLRRRRRRQRPLPRST